MRKPVIFRSVEVPTIFAAVVGFLYLVGYLIDSIFTRNYGIYTVESIKLQYVEVGLVYVLLTLTLAVIPIGAAYITYKVRKKSGLPHFWAGVIGTSLNAANFCCVLIFCAMFITQHEWQMDVRFLGSTLKVKDLFAVYMAAVFGGIAGLPAVERLVMRVEAERTRKAVFRWVLEPLRYTVVVFSILFDVALVTGIAWVGVLAARGSYYLLTVVGLLGGVAVAVGWVRKVKGAGSSTILGVFITIGAVAVLYFSINAYVYGVYRLIPVNRGGKSPLTTAHISAPGLPEALKAEVGANQGVIGPVYVIAENADFIYVAKEGMDEWVRAFVPLHAIPRSSVEYIHFCRVEHGGPRANVSKGRTQR